MTTRQRLTEDRTRRAKVAQQDRVFAYIAEQRAADPQAWDAKVNAFVLANDCAGATLQPDGWFTDPQGRRLYPVGSVRWQWEEERFAAAELG
jgi:hypothetical protein